MVKTVVVVDDSPLTCMTVRNVLERAGYRVFFFLSGEEFLKRQPWLEARINLIIMDVHLPGYDGISIVEKIRRLPPLAYVPIMMLTADHDRRTVLKALQAGAVDYLVKPFTNEQLLTRVVKIIGFPPQPEETPEQKLMCLVRMECNRARRGKHVFSVLRGLRRNGSDDLREQWILLRVMEELKKKLREIDMVLAVSARELFFVLPLTDGKGARVVVEKVKPELQRLMPGSDWDFTIVTYGEDGEAAPELVRKLRKEA